MDVDENTHLSTNNSEDEFQSTKANKNKRTDKGEKTETGDEEGPAKIKTKVACKEKKPRVLRQDVIAAAREDECLAAAALFGLSNSENSKPLAIKQKTMAVKAGENRKGMGKE